MSERGSNRYDVDRMVAAEDELSFALRSLDDLEEEHRAGNLDQGRFDRLHAEYVVRAAEAARKQQREAKLRTRAAPRRGRFRVIVAVVAVLAAGGTALALQGGSRPRAAGETITGDTSAPSGASDTQRLHAAAQAAMTSGDLAGALKNYLAAIDRDPRDVEALTYAGWISYLGGVPAKAMPLLDAAVRADPTYPDAHAFRGIVLFKARQDRTGAAGELRQYLRLVPDGQMSGQVRAVLAQVQRR
jgi:tetratricopeptide (TPR) repeat protein